MTLDTDEVYGDLGAYGDAAALRRAGLLNANAPHRRMILTVSGASGHEVPAIASVALEAAAVDCWSAVSRRRELVAARDALLTRLYVDASLNQVAVLSPIVAEFLGAGLALTAAPDIADRVRRKLAAEDAEVKQAQRALEVGGLWPR